MQRLHTQRWEQQGESGVLADPRVLACHREALPLLARAGMLRMLCLRLNGEEIGVLYTVVDPVGRAVSEGRTQYFYLNAYSTEHAELSPGTVMLALAIEQAATEGVQTIDMLRGEESYKTMWHTVQFATEGFALSC
jgi:CelD/BcsL family acetyltransferase involved in cellulose biosynthesis